MSAYILAGDIGATKTVLSLADDEGRVYHTGTFQNRAYSCFQDVLTAFLADQENRPEYACFGVAGPVRQNQCQMTNLSWGLNGSQLANQFDFKQAFLVNDLVATAAGVASLPVDRLISLNPGIRDPDGNIGVIAVGTGLGQSFALPCHGRFHPLPTEGGHVSFAPRNKEQVALLGFMQAQQRHVSVEQVCSGMAFPTLYHFMCTRYPEPDWMLERRQQTAAVEQTRIIVEAANAAVTQGPPCEPAVRAVQIMIDILADEAANLALKVLATGGIYLGGGMIPRLLSFLNSKQFMGIFSRGVYQEMLADIPIYLILEPDTALIGARQLAIDAAQLDNV